MLGNSSSSTAKTSTKRCLSDKLCECGCGERVTVHYGVTRRFVYGHSRNPLSYEVEDRGYRTPCWIWQGSTSSGYGVFCKNYRNVFAHRYFFEKHRHAIPDGLHIDHLCRVRACCNPDHLEPVTMAENCRRGAKAKLNWSAVFQARLMFATTTLTGSEIAEIVGVTKATMSLIRNNRIWSPMPSA